MSNIDLNGINRGESMLWKSGSMIFDIVDLVSICESRQFVHVTTNYHNLANIEGWVSRFFFFFFVGGDTSFFHSFMMYLTS